MTRRAGSASMQRWWSPNDWGSLLERQSEVRGVHDGLPGAVLSGFQRGERGRHADNQVRIPLHLSAESDRT
jgi:hypothetical protein